MKYSIILTALLSVSSLFGADQVKSVNTEVVEQANAQVAKAQSDAAQAQQDAATAQAELATIEAMKEEAEMKAMAKQEAKANAKEALLKANDSMHISVIGQGVAPMSTVSPAQAYALAKRAAIADAYRAIAEKVKGVRIDGQDLIKNMMVKRSTIRTEVKAMVRNANVVETTFKEGLCEVEMEIVISHSDFAQ
ncbi:LPP20 family lipoprotein [Sulfurimonas sp.]|nr:LPP20 family lipoprotein [Sulfurimonas sp.]